MAAARNENNKIIDWEMTSGPRCWGVSGENQNRDNADTNNPGLIRHPAELRILLNAAETQC